MIARRQKSHEEIFICHKGSKGAEKIAAAWARARGVQQAKFDPRWSAHGKAAPFKCNDGGNGVAMNLGQKAEDKGITVMRVTADGKVAK